MAAAKGEWFSPDDFGWMDGCPTSLALYIEGGRASEAILLAAVHRIIQPIRHQTMTATLNNEETLLFCGRRSRLFASPILA